MNYCEATNNSQLATNLDLLEEFREKAQIRQAAYQHRVANFFNLRVSPRSFVVGDWVFCKVLQNTRKTLDGTLSANWEGPYQVTKVLRGGAYALMDPKGRELGHPWNAEHLKKFYQ